VYEEFPRGPFFDPFLFVFCPDPNPSLPPFCTPMRFRLMVTVVSDDFFLFVAFPQSSFSVHQCAFPFFMHTSLVCTPPPPHPSSFLHTHTPKNHPFPVSVFFTRLPRRHASGLFFLPAPTGLTAHPHPEQDTRHRTHTHPQPAQFHAFAPRLTRLMCPPRNSLMTGGRPRTPASSMSSLLDFLGPFE